MRSLILYSSGFLGKSGVEEPRKNAEELLSFVLQEPVLNLYLQEKRRISPEEAGLFRRLVLKRAGFIPLQYLTKKVDFYGYEFFVKKGVFIPRPETEMLVEEAVNIYARHFSPRYARILDIGTGSGNISVTLAGEIDNCSIVATDISAGAMDAAILNADRYRFGAKIRFEKCSLFPGGSGKFDIIVSNPPYIPTGEIPFLPEEVKKEPRRALAGGRDGIAVIKKILHGAAIFLSDGGYLLLEIGCGQAGMLREMDCALDLKAVKKDLSGIERYAIFQKRGIRKRKPGILNG